MESIIDELDSIVAVETCGVSVAIALIKELCGHSETGQLPFSQIRVPDRAGQMRPCARVCIAEGGDKTELPSGWYIAHSDIFQFRNPLHIPDLAEVVLNELDPLPLPDLAQVSERIRSALPTGTHPPTLYQTLLFFIKQGATNFSVLLDSKVHQDEHVLTDKLALLQGSRSLVIYSDTQLPMDEMVALRQFNNLSVLSEIFCMTEVSIIPPNTSHELNLAPRRLS